MTAKYLFPYGFKSLGWILFLTGIVLGGLFLFWNFEPGFLNVKVFAIAEDEVFKSPKYFKVTETNLIDELAAIFTIVGGLLIAFSQEKIEDEFIRKIRLESLVWAFFANYIILLLATFFVYGGIFLLVSWINLASPLIFFIAKFHYELLKLKRQ